MYIKLSNPRINLLKIRQSRASVDRFWGSENDKQYGQDVSN